MLGLQAGGRSLAVSLMVAIAVVALLPLRANAEGAREGPCVALDQDVVIVAGDVRDCDLLVFDGNATIEQGATLRGDIWLLGGDLTVEQGAVVDGDVAVMSGDTDVAGEVVGGIYGAGDITVRGTSLVHGDLRALGNITREQGSKVTGAIGQIGVPAVVGQADERTRAERILSRAISGVALMVFSVLFAALTVIVAPGLVENVREGLRQNPVASFGLGLVSLVLFPILLLLLLPTIIGVLILPLVYLAAEALGLVALSELAGRRMWPTGARSKQAAVGSGLLALLLSLGLAGGIRVICGSFLIGLFASAWVLGSVLLTVFGTRPRLRGGPVLAPPEIASGLVDGEEEAEGEAELPVLPISEDIAVVGEPAVNDEAPIEKPEDPGKSDEPVVTEEGMETLMEGEETAGGEFDLPADTGPTPGWGWAEAAAQPPAESTSLPAPEPPGGDASEPPADEASTPGASAADDPEGSVHEPEEVSQYDLTEPAPTPDPVPTSASDTNGGHVLEDIPGITPIYAQLLREAGLPAPEDLAAATPDHIAELLSVPGVRPLDRRAAARWIEGARQLIGG